MFSPLYACVGEGGKRLVRASPRHPGLLPLVAAPQQPNTQLPCLRPPRIQHPKPRIPLRPGRSLLACAAVVDLLSLPRTGGRCDCAWQLPRPRPPASARPRTRPGSAWRTGSGPRRCGVGPRARRHTWRCASCGRRAPLLSPTSTRLPRTSTYCTPLVSCLQAPRSNSCRRCERRSLKLLLLSKPSGLSWLVAETLNDPEGNHWARAAMRRRVRLARGHGTPDRHEHGRPHAARACR